MQRASRRPIIAGIAGGSGSGKSWLAEKLALALKEQTVLLSLDDFYLDRSHLSAARRARINFDHPRAIDWRRLEAVLKRLRTGRAASVPSYDFSTHCRLRSSKQLSPKPIILVEGLWTLRPAALRRLFDLRLFLECPTRTRLQRRLTRDVTVRGRTPASVRTQFWSTVEPMHCKHVSPQKRWADVVLGEGWGEGETQILAALLRSFVLNRSSRIDATNSSTNVRDSAR